MTQLRTPLPIGSLPRILLLLALATPALGDNIVLKNGIVYRGSVDKDNTLVFIFDGLKRVVTRDSKIARIEADSSFGNWEVFKLVQPLELHGGLMPKEASDIRATPWDDKGRRTFEYQSARSTRPIA